MFRSLLLLVTFPATEKSNSSPAQAPKSSSFLNVRATPRITLIVSLLIGFAINALLRLVKKPGQLDPSQVSPESLSDDEASAEYGLLDEVLIVSDDELMTDLPLLSHGDCHPWDPEIMEEFDAEVISN
jgi:hypothetical protein